MDCSRCLMPASRPDTQFVDGLCSACVAFDARDRVNWDTQRLQLEQLLEAAHHPGNAYDCIVPSSGGKDSHAQVLTLKAMGASVLAVTATTCHLTPIGRRNLDNLGRFCDTLEVTPNREVRRRLNRAALEVLGDPSWPEHVLIHTVPFRVALEMQIPLVFYGENPLNQYGGPLTRQTAARMTRRWTQEFGGFLGMRPSDFVGLDYGFTADDMAPYEGPPDDQLEEEGVACYWLGQFLPWDSHANASLAKANGFETMLPSRANWWPFENLDNAQTGLHDFLMWSKYGYGRACAQASVDIRSGRLTRAAAEEVVADRDGRLPENYCGVGLEDVLGRLDYTREQFEELCAEFHATT